MRPHRDERRVARLRAGTGPLAVLLAALTVAGGADAGFSPSALAPAVAASQAEPARMELSVPLTLNARYVGDVDVRVDVTGEGEADAARLAALLSPRLDAELSEALAALSAGRAFVPFAELAEAGITAAFDLGALELGVEVDAALMGQSALSLTARTAPDPSRFDAPSRAAAGVGLTLSQGYDFGADRDGGGLGPARAAFEGYANIGGFHGPALLFRFDLDEGADEPFRRREVLAQKDLYDDAIRVSVGDLNAPLTAFQVTPGLLGVSVARRYQAIQPYRNVLSSGRSAFVLENDSVVDVFVNGVLTETLELQPGRFELTDFPFSTGGNDVRLVIQDDTGAEEIVAFSFFADSALLAEGLLDFAVTGGVERTVNPTGFDYGDAPIISGFARYGLGSAVNVGANFQASEETLQLGGSATLGSRLGITGIELSGSDDAEAGGGYALAVDHRLNGTVGEASMNLAGVLLYRSQGFRGVGVSSTQALFAQANLRASVPSVGNLNLALARVTTHTDAPGQTTVSLGVTRPLGRVNLSLTGNYSRTGGEERVAAIVGLSMRLGRRYGARARYGTANERFEAELTRSASADLGDVSGNVRYTNDARAERVSGALRYRHNRFEGDLAIERLARDGLGAERVDSASRWRLASFVGYADGKVGIGRRAPNGFVIAGRHRSLSGSRLSIVDGGGGGRVLARDGLFGPALVPLGRGYTPRRLGVEVDPLPEGYDLGAGQLAVFPGPANGYATTVGSDASRTLLGIVTGPDGAPVDLKVGELVPVSGDEALSRQLFTNSVGRFVAERVAAGEYVLEVAGRRSAPFTIEQDTEGLVDVGTITLQP